MTKTVALPNQTNYRKIIAQGYVDLNSAASSSSVTETVTHSLGYEPDFTVFVEDYADHSLLRETDYIVKGGLATLGFGFYIDIQVTATANETQLNITLNTPLNSTSTNPYYALSFTLRAKYFIYESPS